MTKKTKIVIGISVAVLIMGSFVGYKIYQKRKINKLFTKNPDEEKASANGFDSMRVEYKTPLWVVG